MALSVNQVLAALKSLLPPGAQDLYDFAEGDVGRILEGLAEAWKTYGYDPCDQLAANVNPLTCDAGTLATWEVVLGLSLTRIAARGALEQRRSQVISKLREAGPTSRPNVRSIIGPLLGYVDSTQVVIIEANRTALREAHTYSYPAGVIPALGFYDQIIRIFDSGKVSRAGARIYVNITILAVESVSISIRTPDGTNYVVAAVGSLGTGAVVDQQYSFFLPAVRGEAIAGNWELFVENAGVGAGTVNVLGTTKRTDIFVEGIGRVDFTDQQGLVSGVFSWGVLVDPTLVGQAHAADLDAARAALLRIKQGHTFASLIVGSSIAPGGCWIPDVSLPDALIPCA